MCCVQSFIETFNNKLPLEDFTEQRLERALLRPESDDAQKLFFEFAKVLNRSTTILKFEQTIRVSVPIARVRSDEWRCDEL